MVCDLDYMAKSFSNMDDPAGSLWQQLHKAFPNTRPFPLVNDAARFHRYDSFYVAFGQPIDLMTAPTSTVGTFVRRFDLLKRMASDDRFVVGLHSR